MKKIRILIVAILAISMVFVGCTSSEEGEAFDIERDITVVARDAASGTRGAFHEIMGIIQKERSSEIDRLVVGALEFDGTDKVITAVEGDKYGIEVNSIW